MLFKIKDRDIEISFDNKKYFAPKSLKNLKRILKNSNTKFLSGGTAFLQRLPNKEVRLKKLFHLIQLKN